MMQQFSFSTRLECVSLLVLAAVPAAVSEHAAAWRFQRMITPAHSAPDAQQCVVLDADLYAQAAPGLRDVRLLQDGRELPYATDISERDFTDDGIAASEDRAQYDTALQLHFSPEQVAAYKSASPALVAWGTLPAHVPVERIRVEPAPAVTWILTMRAAPLNDLNNAETLDAQLKPGEGAALFTIGANLQQPARIVASLQGPGQLQARLLLEMRRREICYQPLSASPVQLLLGNEAAEPRHYDFAAHFQPQTEPLLANLGPRMPNPAFREPVAGRRWRPTRVQMLCIAIGACALLLVLTLAPLLKLRR